MGAHAADCPCVLCSATRLVESLGGDMRQLADVLVTLDRKKTERRITFRPLVLLGSARTIVVGGTKGARIEILAYLLTNTAIGAAGYQWQAGSGPVAAGSWRNLSGDEAGSASSLALAPTGGVHHPVGSPDSPLLSGGMGDDIAINVTTATPLNGFLTYTTIETGP